MNYLWRGLGSSSYDSQILAAIPQYCPSCPPAMVEALVQTESSGNPNAVSPAGAIGLFQLMPATAASLNVNPNDVSGNIQGGLTYLQQLYNQFGDWTETLEAYNEGPGALQSQLSSGITPTSSGYASGILSAAGMLDSTASTDLSDVSADLGISSPSDGLDDLSDSMDSLSIGDVPGIAVVAGIALLIGVGIYALA